MGLDVSIGILDDLRQNDEDAFERFCEIFTAVNELLLEHGLPRHEEPVELPQLGNRFSISGFPYYFLHCLRRVAANVSEDPNWKAAPVAGDAVNRDPALKRQYRKMTSHLLAHSDCEGLYVPIEFRDVIIDKQKRVPGDIIGSSQQLFRELVQIAPSLGISLSGTTLSDAEADRLNELGASGGALSAELITWLSLFEAARLSIEYKTAIVFG